MVIAHNEMWEILDAITTIEELKNLLDKKNRPTISQLNDRYISRQRDNYLKATKHL